MLQVPTSSKVIVVTCPVIDKEKGVAVDVSKKAGFRFN